jgi:hypothetical protein
MANIETNKTIILVLKYWVYYIYHLVLNIYLTQGTTAVHRNKNPHISQETMECLKHWVSIERGIRFK